MKNTLLPLLVVALLAGCSALGNNALSSARNRWNAAHIAHYRYQLRVGCFCAFTTRMPLTIEVQNGQIVSMTYNDGTPVGSQDQQIFAGYDTIDKLFDFTAASSKKADEIKIEYDPAYGFPSSVQIDFIKQAADDELALNVSNFQALP